MADIKQDIFREYDIRGIYGRDLTETYAGLIGRAYGTLIKRRGGTVVSTGRDCRLSSPSLSEAFIEGVTSTGINVINIGIVSTPILYFSLFNLEVDGGVMLTASHNPGDYNGLKLCVGRDSLFGNGIQGLRELILNDDFEQGEGSASVQPITEVYVKYMKDSFNLRKDLKVAMDCGNGMVGLVGPRVLKEMGVDLTELYSEPAYCIILREFTSSGPFGRESTESDVECHVVLEEVAALPRTLDAVARGHLLGPRVAHMVCVDHVHTPACDRRPEVVAVRLVAKRRRACERGTVGAIEGVACQVQVDEAHLREHREAPCPCGLSNAHRALR